MSRTIWTIGHSTRAWDEFVALLRHHGIRAVADVRSFPGSRRHPQFNREAMERALPEAGISYTWRPELGGRRKARPDSANTAWRHVNFRGYADYMETPAFAAALAALEGAAADTPTAFMCSEAVWWRCHRGLISDALKARGWEVLHITDEKTPKPHPFTPPARLENGALTYRESRLL